MRKIYFLFSMLLASVFSMAQVTLLDFEGAGPFAWTNFDGGNTTVIANPQSVGINTSTKVGQTIKGPGGQPWGGSWIQLAANIDFTTMKTMRMKVFSTAPGIPVLLKVENETDGNKFYQKTATTTATNAWEDLTFDFSGIITANTYKKVVIIFREGTTGDGTAAFTFLFDDIRQEGPPPGALTLPTLPVNFESATVDYTFTNFDGGASTIVANPQKSGINTSDTVARLVKQGTTGAGFDASYKSWAGSLLVMAAPMDFSTNKVFKVKVFSPRADAKLLLKVEGAGAPFEREVSMTKANEWEELTFDYSAVSTSILYNKLVFIFDLGTMGNGGPNFTFLVDDIRLVAAGGGGGGGGTQMNLPVTFDDPAVAYGLVAFEGGVSSIVTDPTNPANKVGRSVKGLAPGVKPWAGATITVPGTPEPGFSNRIPFTDGNAFITIRIWSPDAGIPVLLKAEVHTDNTKSVETISNTTIAGGWENVTFNFANHRTGTTPINYALNYNKLSIFFNYLVDNATEKTYYFDDVVFGSSALPVKLLSFDAEKVNQGVNFAWTTTAEVNNKEFGVQRSETGEKWTDIAVVRGQGTASGTHSYTATDIMPLPGINYYRLRQTDFDGKSVYSKVKVIDFSGNATEALKVYPNPAKGRVNVISSSFAGKVGYTILGADGRQVGSGVLQNTLSATGINISNLKPGIYILKLQNEENTKTSKFIVQ